MNGSNNNNNSSMTTHRLAAYVINLPRRPDRYRDFQAQWPRFSFTRVFATPNAQQPAQGCTRSHLRVYRRVLARPDVDWVLVCEDDCEWLVTPEEFSYHIKTWLADAPRADVFLLARNLQHAQRHGPHLQRVNVALSTAAYLVRRSYVPRLINSALTSLRKAEPIDVGFTRLQRRDRWFTGNRPLARQRAGFSDIERRNVDYGC